MRRCETLFLVATLISTALCLPVAPAHAAVVDASPSGFTIENVETVPVTPAAAFKALVENVGRWWPADHTWWGDANRLSIEPRAGGCFCELNGAQQASHMRVSFVDPGRLLRMTGGLGPLQGMGLHGALDWRFEAVEGGTRITVHYRVGGYTPDDLSTFAPVVDQVQGVQLGGLARFLRAGTEP
jgi:uncharacterized protein YndB with AHSA1/START domain